MMYHCLCRVNRKQVRLVFMYVVIEKGEVFCPNKHQSRSSGKSSGNDKSTKNSVMCRVERYVGYKSPLKFLVRWLRTYIICKSNYQGDEAVLRA